MLTGEDPARYRQGEVLGPPGADGLPAGHNRAQQTVSLSDPVPLPLHQLRADAPAVHVGGGGPPSPHGPGWFPLRDLLQPGSLRLAERGPGPAPACQLSAEQLSSELL